jgi:hypothetical protein
VATDNTLDGGGNYGDALENDPVLPGNGHQYLLSDVTLPRLRQ